jgi:hypothetical protein
VRVKQFRGTPWEGEVTTGFPPSRSTAEGIPLEKGGDTGKRRGNIVIYAHNTSKEVFE